MVDVFEYLNIINISLQGKDNTILDASEKISSLVMKIDLWLKKVPPANLTMFGNLNKHMDENEMVADDCMLNGIRQQLTMLKEKLKNILFAIFIHFSLLCLIFVTQMSEENFSLTDFVCQMTEMKSTVHPKEILLFKNGHQLFNHIYITIHE